MESEVKGFAEAIESLDATYEQYSKNRTDAHNRLMAQVQQCIDNLRGC